MYEKGIEKMRTGKVDAIDAFNSCGVRGMSPDDAFLAREVLEAVKDGPFWRAIEAAEKEYGHGC